MPKQGKAGGGRGLLSSMVAAANWAELSGPYAPHHTGTWSARWGHAVVVVNQTEPRLVGRNITSTSPRLLLLGGDDYDLDLHGDVISGPGGESSGGGLCNDVWVTDPSQLQRVMIRSSSGGSSYLRGSTSTDLPSDELDLHLRWNQTNPGRNAPVTWPSEGRRTGSTNSFSYDDWIACQEYFEDDECNPGGKKSQQASWKKDNMWNARRGHAAAVTSNNALYVIGGRARERRRIDDSRLFGGVHIHDYRVETLKDYATTREELVLKNDVWVSQDGLGKEWKLVTPGCRDPQEDVLRHTRESWTWTGRDDGSDDLRQNIGSVGSRCTTSSDCYGSAKCTSLDSNTGSSADDKVCVCNMFSPREHHSVVVQQRSYTDKNGREYVQDYLFVVGGFARVRQSFCGDHACGSSGYRVALDDAWVSTDGLNWLQLKPAFDENHVFRGRGGHAALMIHSNSFNQQTIGGRDRLVVLGGETFHPKEPETIYLNDIWSIELSTMPCCRRPGICKLSYQMMNEHGCLPNIRDWFMERNADWSGRSGHVSLYEPPSAHNSFTERAYVMGGMNEEDGILSDAWTWNIVPGSFVNAGGNDRSNLQKPKPWARDFDGTSQDHGPYKNYLSIDSEVSALIRYRLPTLSHNDLARMNTTTSYMISSSPLMNQQDVGKMNALGIVSIKDLADANVYDILKLRGINNPWLEEVPAVQNICHLKSLADAFVKKCSSSATIDGGSISSPRHVADYSTDSSNGIRKRTYSRKDFTQRNSTYCVVKLPSSECLPYDWDGCASIAGVNEVDVYGLGNIAVPKPTDEPSLHSDLEELHCRRTPSGRYMAAGAYVDNKAIVLGGRDETLHTLHQDTWARDDTFPLAAITTKPRNHTAETRFEFSSNEPTAQKFEYKVYDVDKGVELTTWQSTTIVAGADVSWLDYRNGGPGKGYYTLYVRAIDLSGNCDVSYGKPNVYTWRYVPRPPIGKVLAGILSALFFISVLIFEYRRRKRKAALERYALRRMRRKYRLQQAMMRDDDRENGGRRRVSPYQWQRFLHDEDKSDTNRRSVEWGDRSYSRQTRSPRERSGRSRSSRDRTSRSRSSTRDVDGDEAGDGYYSRRREKRIKHDSSRISLEGERSRAASFHRGKLSSRERQRQRERERRRRQQRRKQKRETSATGASGASKKRR